jgi:hypothetical protein
MNLDYLYGSNYYKNEKVITVKDLEGDSMSRTINFFEK